MRRQATCFECGEEMEETGRNTLYCPSCDVCSDCGCPDADGFQHYAGCETARAIEAAEIDALPADTCYCHIVGHCAVCDERAA